MASRKTKIKKPTVKKPTKAEKISKIPIEEIASLSGEEGMKKLRGYVSALQMGYKRRVGQFKRQNLSSYAQISLEASMSDAARKRKVSDMTRNQLLMEFARYSKFFNSVSSTVAGIKALNREQDARIFGVDEKGNPLNTMTKDERDLYWSVYDEFFNQETDVFSSYGSSRVQQAVAEVQNSGTDMSDKIVAIIKTKSILTGISFDTLWEIYQREKNGDRPVNLVYEDEKSTPNVYSGRGPTFK